MRKSVVLVCVGLWAVAWTGQATEPVSDLFKTFGHGGRAGYLAPDDDVRRVTALSDVTTPHVVFAKPLAGGPLRVLAIAHKSLGRWPIELSQRFDFEVDTVYCHSQSSIGAPVAMTFFGQRHADVEARLLQAMNEQVDVVVSDLPAAALGDKVAARLKELMSEGTGYVGFVDVPELGSADPLLSEQTALASAAVPVAGLRLLSATYGTAEKAAQQIVLLSEGQSGERTALLAGYPRDDKAPEPDWLQYAWLPSMEHEAWCSLTGRAMLWAARRLKPASALVSALPENELARSALPCKLSLSAKLGGAVQLRIWDVDGRLRHDVSADAVPVLPCGRYFLALQQTSEAKVVDWAFGWFDVSDSVRIEAITLDSDRKRPGEPVHATVTVGGTPPQGSSVLFEILDNYGRCVSRQVQPVKGTTQFSGDSSQSLHLYNYANAKLLGPDGSTLDETRHAFILARPNPPTDDFSLMVWEGGASFNPRLRQILTRFSGLGINATLTGTQEETALACAIANMHVVPYVTRVHPEGVNAEGVRSPCLTDPAYNDPLRTKLVDVTKALKGYAPLSYSLGDDQSYLRSGQEGCWSPTCKQAFSEWAREKYGSLDEVNAAWSTGYSDFAEVEPIRRATALADVDTDLGPVCHWLDHQVFIDSMLANWHRDMADAIEQEDPNAVAWYDCTIEGWMRPGSAFDFWKLGSLSRFCVQYPNPIVHDILRETASPEAYHGTWYGGYGIYNIYPYYDADTQPWWCLFRGINLHGLYYGGTGPSYFDERLLGADLGLMPMYERLMVTIDELRGGIAKLVFNAERLDDAVTITFSRPSNHLTMLLPQDLPWAPEWQGQFTGSPNFVYMQHWEAMSALLSDLGLSYRVARCSDLADPPLDTSACRLLVLPLNLRVSEQEAEAIRTFVEEGGVVLADAFPGWFDERARLANGALADVFGVSAQGRIPGAEARERTAATTSGDFLGKLTVASPLTLNGAVPHALADDGTPLLLVNQFGKGHAVLLNVLSRDYQIWRTLGTETAFREAVADLLEEVTAPKATVRCEVKVRGDDTLHRLAGCETHRYRLGDATYVGLVRTAKMRPDDMLYLADNRPKPVWIQFSEPAHVYDVRRGVYRGFVERFDDVMYPGRTEFFALLPYEVRGVDVECSPIPGGTRVKAKVCIDADRKLTTHVFRVEVFNPKGNERRELARNVLAERGKIEQDLFVGYGASPGQWRVRVKDVATGTVREEPFVCSSD